MTSLTVCWKLFEQKFVWLLFLLKVIVNKIWISKYSIALKDFPHWSCHLVFFAQFWVLSHHFLLCLVDTKKFKGPNGIYLTYIKRYLMPLWDLSQLFFNGPGSLGSSQLTGSWQMSQFSRRMRKETLVITGLSATIQCLAKLQRRLLKELMENTQQTMYSLATANTGSQWESNV